MTASLGRRVVAEFTGTGFLVATVIGSGIMGERLAGGNVALALLANSLATGAALVALILAFGAVSGAHFNPAVTLLQSIQRELPWKVAAWYVIAQCSGGVCGAVMAHVMFGLRVVSLASHARSGWAQAFSEFLATSGLLGVIWGCARQRSEMVAFAVGAYITAAYWFTSSTSFANPAVTIARSLSDTFAGIRPRDVPLFVAAQLCAVVVSAFLWPWLFPKEGIAKAAQDSLES
jgi:glycerol uptake facilitator-like aquaporin